MDMSAHGTFYNGIGSLVVAGIAALTWWQSRAARREAANAKKCAEVACERADSIIKQMLTARRARMLEQCQKRDRKTFMAMSYCIENAGIKTMIHLPLFFDEITEPIDGLKMHCISHTKDATLYEINTLDWPMEVLLDLHSHDRTEKVKVISGRMVDLKHGRVYGPGEEWILPAGEPHTATFHRALCIGTMIPALPTAEEQPIDLGAMLHVYDPALDK